MKKSAFSPQLVLYIVGVGGISFCVFYNTGNLGLVALVWGLAFLLLALILTIGELPPGDDFEDLT